MAREIIIKIQTPEMTALKYAEETGMDKHGFKHLPEDQKTDKEKAQIVSDWVQRKYVPSVKTGKHRLVNVVGRTIQLVELYYQEKEAREKAGIEL